MAGGTGLVGAPLVDALVASGHEVIALARSDAAAHALRERGARVVRGDLGAPASWAGAAAGAEMVFHAAAPRMAPPLRGRHVRRMAREAEAGSRAVAAAADPDAVVVLAGCGIGDSTGPLAIAEPGLASERAMAGPALRVVRLPWSYGRSGFIADMARGLAMRRFRIVGPGDNRIALLSARDAADALMASAVAPPGTYAAAEPDMPTQEDLVHHLCREGGVPRPDHLPPRMAGLSMGGVVVQALAADQRVVGTAVPGFVPARSWREHLMPGLAGR